MHDLAVLRDLVLILAVALVTVVVLRRLGVPAIAGLIVSGVVVGPNALGLVDDVHEVEVLAEVGVVLLLFGIGLELSLERLRRLWKAVLVGGLLQMVVTAGGTAAVARWLGLAWPPALFIGFVVAISSTAIVLRGLSDAGEVDAPHGRLALGILVFQDLSVVPLMLAIPLLAGTGGGATALAAQTGKALLVLAGVLVGAGILVPRLLAVIARTRQRDLFVLAVAVICIGTAWLVSTAGISLALGAFLAGLVVAGGDYRSQALTELIPMRDVLASLFFVSVGMLLDPRQILAAAGPIASLLVAIVAGKFLAMVVVGAALRLPARVTIVGAAALCQIGEFSFILLRAADGTGLVSERGADTLTAAVVLSMLLTPLALRYGPHLAAGVTRSSLLTRLLGVTTAQAAAGEATRWRQHVIIAGYGLAGQRLARALRARHIQHVVVDLNPDNVRAAGADGSPAFFGDATSSEVLELLGAGHASELVLTINDPRSEEAAVRSVRRHHPTLHVVARTRFVVEVPPLVEAGASHVIPAEEEAAKAVLDHVLSRHPS